MTIFEAVKSTVTPRMAAEHYGMLECTQYMLDLLTIGSPEERTELVNDMMKDNKITLLQDHLREIKEESNEQT